MIMQATKSYLDVKNSLMPNSFFYLLLCYVLYLTKSCKGSSLSLEKVVSLLVQFSGMGRLIKLIARKRIDFSHCAVDKMSSIF